VPRQRAGDLARPRSRRGAFRIRRGRMMEGEGRDSRISATLRDPAHSVRGPRSVTRRLSSVVRCPSSVVRCPFWGRRSIGKWAPQDDIHGAMSSSGSGDVRRKSDKFWRFFSHCNNKTYVKKSLNYIVGAFHFLQT
jgi:hypothetical protein